MKQYLILGLVSIVFLAGCTSQTTSLEEKSPESTARISQMIDEEVTYLAPANYALKKIEINLTSKTLEERIRWNSSMITYYSKITENTTQRIIMDAINTWNKETEGVIKFVEVDSPEKAYFTIRFVISGEFDEPPPSRLIIVYLGEARLDIVNTGLFNLTKSAEMLYTQTSGECENKVTAIHELGHIIGFSHTVDVNSVMFPSVDCRGKITDDMKQAIKTLYSIKELPDLHFGPVEAKKIGNILNINVTVFNRGLITSKSALVEIRVNDRLVENIELPEIEGGKDWWKELKIDPGAILDSVKLEITSTQEEFDKENNIVLLKSVKKPVELVSNIINYKLDGQLRDDYLLYGKTIVNFEYNKTCIECIYQKWYLESFAKENSNQIILENVESPEAGTSNITIESKRGVRSRSTLSAIYFVEVKESAGPYMISDGGRFKRLVELKYENRTFISPSELGLRDELCSLMVFSSPSCEFEKIIRSNETSEISD